MWKMKKVISTKDMPREEWLEWRKKGIGGSDAAGLVGLSKWSTPFKIYADKMGFGIEKPDNEALRQGRDLEEYVAQRFTEKTGKKVKRMNYLLQHDQYNFIQANVDRVLVNEKSGLECKTMNPRSGHVSGLEEGNVPEQYYVQCQHYMAVTGYNKWYLAILVFGTGFYWFEIPRHEEDIKALVDAEVKFWNEHILTEAPPSPDESEICKDVIKGMYPVENGETVDVSTIDDTIQSLEKVKADIAELEEKKTLYENIIKAELKECSYGKSDAFLISYKNSESNRFDVNKFKEEHPEMDLSGYYKKSSYRTLRIRGIK